LHLSNIMKHLTRDQVFKIMKKNGHVIFENDSREHNLNIIGVRSKTAKIDEFGDQLLVDWKYQDVWHNRSYTITTYPGSHYLLTILLIPMVAAILVLV